MEAVPIAQMLGLTCPDHPGVRLNDAIGPFRCPVGHDVSVFTFLKTSMEIAKAEMLRRAAEPDYCTCTPEQAAAGPCGKPVRQL